MSLILENKQTMIQDYLKSCEEQVLNAQKAERARIRKWAEQYIKTIILGDEEEPSPHRVLADLLEFLKEPE